MLTEFTIAKTSGDGPFTSAPLYIREQQLDVDTSLPKPTPSLLFRLHNLTSFLRLLTSLTAQLSRIAATFIHNSIPFLNLIIVLHKVNAFFRNMTNLEDQKTRAVMTSKAPRMFLQETNLGQKLQSGTRSRLHALRNEVPLEHRVSISDAYRLKRLAIWEARRNERRTIDGIKRRGIPFEQPTVSIPRYVKLIIRPGARIFSERGHVDATSEVFRRARKRTRRTQYRMAKDEEAANMLYNARHVVSMIDVYMITH